jgi:hypothetical protein
MNIHPKFFNEAKVYEPALTHEWTHNQNKGCCVEQRFNPNFQKKMKNQVS